jgi:DNA-binding CsgD family transcriptional regulator
VVTSALPPHRLEKADRSVVQEIAQELARAPTIANDGGVVPQWLGETLREALKLELFLAYRPTRRKDALWGLGERVAHGPPGFFDAYEEAIARFPTPFHYDPLRPPLEQRDRVLARADICQHDGDGECVVDAVWPAFGIARHDQLRVLVCGGPLVRAWVGGLREEPFRPREKTMLAALGPALRRHTGLRRKLLDAGLARAGLEAAVGILAAPAFVMDPDGHVMYANPVAVELFDREPAEVTARLRRALAGADPASEVAPLSPSGARPVFLVVLREAGSSLESRLALARAQWKLTARELDVLRLLVMGESNKEIAAHLGCHEGNVERHVTSLLRKAHCDSRSRVVAKFWTAR